MNDEKMMGNQQGKKRTKDMTKQFKEGKHPNVYTRMKN